MNRYRLTLAGTNFNTFVSVKAKGIKEAKAEAIKKLPSLKGKGLIINKY